MVGGSFLFQDAESGEQIVVDLSEQTVLEYKNRLQNLQEGLEEESFRRGGRYCLLKTHDNFSAACRALIGREILLPQ